MSVSKKNYFAIVLILLLLTWCTSAKPPAVIEKDKSGKDSDLQQLEALLSGNSGEASTEVTKLYPAPESAFTQMYGLPDPLDPLFKAPNADYFANDTAFSEFFNIFYGQKVKPANVSYRELSLQSSLSSGPRKDTGMRVFKSEPFSISFPSF